VRKRTFAAFALAAALALPGTALAKFESGGGVGSGGGEPPSSGNCTLVADRALTSEELAANDQAMMDAWKSRLYAYKAGGTG
jgi:hypothetical protein